MAYKMKTYQRQKGSVMLIAVFVIALLSSLVIGMLQINTEEIQLMQNQMNATQALAVAEAGLNDVFSELRMDNNWSRGFADKSFGSHAYTVTVSGSPPDLTIESTGTSSQGFVAKVAADIKIGGASPHTIRIKNLRINE